MATRITAKVQVDAWMLDGKPLADGTRAEYPRRGDLGRGYHLVFTRREGVRSHRVRQRWDRLERLARPRAGSSGYTNFAWKVNTRYQFDMRIEGGKLIGRSRMGDRLARQSAVGLADVRPEEVRLEPVRGLAGVNGGTAGTYFMLRDRGAPIARPPSMT